MGVRCQGFQRLGEPCWPGDSLSALGILPSKAGLAVGARIRSACIAAGGDSRFERCKGPLRPGSPTCDGPRRDGDIGAFPSGHATDAAACLLAGSFVLALTVAVRRRGQLLWLLAGLVGAGLVGLSRLILAVHWLSDVVAGWALGTAIAILVVVASWYWVTRVRPSAMPKPRCPVRRITAPPSDTTGNVDHEVAYNPVAQ